jgi:hypothetical protein
MHLWDWLLPLMVGAGLFFINIKPYHDWGDDFAQYLQQAENLTKGKALGESSYQFNPSFSRIGPQVYPPGFSLFLSFIHPVDGSLNLEQAQVLISFFGLLFVLFSHLLLRSFGIQRIWALVISILLIYHPYFIHQKSEVLSDIPFAALFLGSVYFFTLAKKWQGFILAGILGGLAICTRSVGLVLPLAALFYLLFNLRSKINWRHPLIFVLSCLVVGVGLNYTLGYYRVNQNGYAPLFSSTSGFWAILNFNFTQYLETFEQLFIPDGNSHIHIFLVILQKIAIGALFVGAFIKLRQKRSFINILVILYLGVLMVYPYTGGYRFLIPLLPIFMLWIIAGFHAIKLRKFAYVNLLASLVCILLLASYWPELSRFKQTEKQAFPGPQLPEALALYEWLERIPDEQTVLFGKPRALAYYTGQNTVATEPEVTRDSFANDLGSFEVQYLISGIDVYYPTLNEYVEKHEFQLVYENFRFKVWKLY